MLVLSRKRDEKILFQVPGMERDIEITVVEIEGSRVRLGISASSDVTILRSELTEKKTVSLNEKKPLKKVSS